MKNNWKEKARQRFEEFAVLHDEDCDMHFEGGQEPCKCCKCVIIDELMEICEEAVSAVIYMLKEKVERIKLDMDVVVCDCGEPYRESDPADLINELCDILIRQEGENNISG